MMPPTDGATIAAEAHRRWAANCPRCAGRRILWPAGQNVNTGREHHAQWIHTAGGKRECS